jgi:hypothetical protein
MIPPVNVVVREKGVSSFRSFFFDSTRAYSCRPAPLQAFLTSLARTTSIPCLSRSFLPPSHLNFRFAFASTSTAQPVRQEDSYEHQSSSSGVAQRVRWPERPGREQGDRSEREFNSRTKRAGEAEKGGRRSVSWVGELSIASSAPGSACDDVLPTCS